MNTPQYVIPLTKENLNKFLDDDVQQLIDVMREMRMKTKLETINYPYFSFLNKLVKFSGIAMSVFAKECAEVQRLEEEKELDGSIDTISIYDEDDSGEEELEVLSHMAEHELLTITKDKGYLCTKNHVLNNVTIACPN